MPTSDIVIFVIIFFFIFNGWRGGLLRTVGSLIGLIVGVLIASRYYLALANWLLKITEWNGNFAKIVMFAAAFIIISRLVGLLFTHLINSFAIVRRLPLVGFLDGVLGLTFGLLEGVLLVGVLVYFMSKFPISPAVMKELTSSRIAPYCLKAGAILVPFIPDAVRTLPNTL